MVDSNDRERVGEAREELMRMLAEDELRDAVLLIFANKQVSRPLTSSGVVREVKCQSRSFWIFLSDCSDSSIVANKFSLKLIQIS